MDAVTMVALRVATTAAPRVGSPINVAAIRIPAIMEQHRVSQPSAVLEMPDEAFPILGQPPSWADHLPLHGYLRQIRLMMAGRIDYRSMRPFSSRFF